MAKTLMTKEEFDRQFYSNKSNTNSFDSKIFDFKIELKPCHKELVFINCDFLKGITFCKGIPSLVGAKKNDKEEDLSRYSETNVFSESVFFEECDFQKQIKFDDIIFSKKFRMLNCSVDDASFRNTVFNDLADFWSTTFKKDIIFYKTDFNKTVVFSMATFIGNVLFTYSLFAAKVILARTKFKRGVDLSQSIISWQLKPFDLQFDFKEFKAEYVGKDDKDDEKYQRYISKEAKIPLVNKLHTFQVLKKAFEDIGNYPDSILMLREEKTALKKLVKEKLKDKDSSVNIGDRCILKLNRISNNYKSDFRNGIWFILAVAIIFGTPTLIFTEAFQNNICCCNCTFNVNAVTKGMKFIFTFLNPTHHLSYLENLNPIFDVSYIFDFFGRIAVGYGIYQTVQAFRKFK